VCNCPLTEGNRPRRFLSHSVSSNQLTSSNHYQVFITSLCSSNQVTWQKIAIVIEEFDIFQIEV
jgi:hypothetical protein